MEHWTTDEFMKHLARAEWTLQNLRGLALEQDSDQGGTAQQQDEAKLVHEMIKQGIDPMMELYDPDKHKNMDMEKIRGIDWRGELEK